MKINASLLFHEIQRYFQVDYVKIGYGQPVKSPMFYNVFFECDEHIVLLPATQLTECLARVNHAIILCLDPMEHIPEIGENDLLVINDPMSRNMAFNVLTHIIERFQEWENAMNDVLYHSHSFQDMVDLTAEMVGLPIALVDSRFRYIAYSKDSYIYLNDYVSADNTLTPQAISELQKNPNFHKLDEIHQAFEDNTIDPLVCKNLFNDGIYVGRLNVIHKNDPEEVSFFKAMFDVAVPFMEKLYAQYNSFSNISLEYRKIHDFLSLILERKPVDHRAFSELMRSMGSLENDMIRVSVLVPRQQRRSMYSTSFICNDIEQRIPGAYCVSFEDRITVLINESLNQRLTNHNCYREFPAILGNILFDGCLSREFSPITGFDNIYFAYRQAVYVESRISHIGEELLHRFEEYALDFLVANGSGGCIVEQICHPALIRLRDHDRRHGTSFLQTLQTYLLCNMNAVQTAKTLYIHRSSFINRMDRIQELVSLDLSDPDERLYLNLSLKIFADDLR